MNILELFAGSRSISKVGKKMGHKVFTSDIEDFEEIDYVIDVLNFDYKKVLFIPDMIWASPPCTGFSVASIGHHWQGGVGAYIPKSQTALLGIRLMEKTLEIIRHYQMINPNLVWYMENPRGVMRKMPQLTGLERKTVTYCQYGDTRMKPTDIWTNNKSWKPREKCSNGSPCHVAAPRGSKTGTQGLKGSFDRSKIPASLCREVIISCQ